MPAIKLLRVGYFMAQEGVLPTPKPALAGQEFVEIITSGAVKFDSGDGGRYYGVGTIFRHREGEYTVYESQPGHPYHCLVLHFAVSGTERRPRVTSWFRPETLPVFAKDVRRCFNHPGCDREMLGEYTYSTLDWHVWQSRQTPQTNELPPAIGQILEFIRRHWDEPLTVDRLAAEAGLSRPYFQHLFLRHLHRTPHRYLLQLRLQRAGDMLAASNVPIKEIAIRCGFENIESFYRAFKKVNHDSPANYRRSHSPQNWN